MRKLTDDEIRATPIPEGYRFKCFSRNPKHPTEIRLHLECDKGHAIIQLRANVMRGVKCGICAKKARNKKPDNWREILNGLEDDCGFVKAAKALGVVVETFKVWRSHEGEFKELTDRLKAPRYQGGRTNPNKETLLRENEELKAKVEQLEDENRFLRKNHKPLSTTDQHLLKLTRQVRFLHERLLYAEEFIPSKAEYFSRRGDLRMERNGS